MPTEEHEELLLAGMEAMRKQGYRVIRLDKRIVPDAIAVKDDQVVALEAATNATTVWLSKQKIQPQTQYDETLVITKPYSDRYYPRGAYQRALELRRMGYTYSHIRDVIFREFGKRPSFSTLHDWTTGTKKPPEA